MQINYSIQSFQKGTHRIPRETFRYILVLGGEAVLHTPVSDFALNPHSMIELPPGPESTLDAESESGIMLGILELQDFYVVQIEIRLIPPGRTDLLRKLFFLAVDIEGILLPRKAAIHNALDHLVFETITSTGIIVDSMNPAIYHFIEDVTQKYRDPEYDYTRLIRESGYSFNHFRKLFKDSTGTTPLNFLHVLRIDCAKALMRRYGRDLTLREVAERSGFSDPYYFSRVFKKFEKISPSEYLNSLDPPGK